MTDPGKREEWHPPDWAIVAFVLGLFLLVGTVFVVQDVSEGRVRSQVLAAVGNTSVVRVDGQQVDNPTPLLRSLGQVDHMAAHHSHPTAPIHIDLIGGRGTTQIVIARDSERLNEFWVFRSGSGTHGDLGQSAGRIVSSDLNNLLRARGL